MRVKKPPCGSAGRLFYSPKLFTLLKKYFKTFSHPRPKLLTSRPIWGGFLASFHYSKIDFSFQKLFKFLK
jgi:hypothetical protein